jgi:ArsR family transcriptional regulator, arsenate/arsenite/antimonite-responsive transcriptional repressor
MAMDRAQIERISKALGDKTRLQIFEAISSSRHMSCQDIVALRGVTPATVSHHMKILSDANLIRCRREGQFVYSEAVPATIAAFGLALRKIAVRRKPRASSASRKSARSR